MGNEVKLTVELTDEFLHDVMTNTVESGATAYWAMIDHVIRDADLNVTEFQIVSNEIDLHVNSVEDMLFVIDKAAIVKGINAVLDPKFQVAAYIQQYVIDAVKNGDAGFIDAEAGDVIVQATMFDEIVFG